MYKWKNIEPGMKIGRLLVIKQVADYVSPNGRTAAKWKCKCSNEGNIVIVRESDLKYGRTKSCGCLSRELRIKNNKLKATHKMCSTPEYTTYCGIKDRCLNKNAPGYHNYGGRGIKVCKHWLESFENFYKNMGPKPEPKENYSIDRKDNDLHYSCGHCKECRRKGWRKNCVWATQEEQNRNKRTTKLFTYKGITGTIEFLLEYFNIKMDVSTARLRLKKGMSITEALMTPLTEVVKLSRNDVYKIREKFSNGKVTKIQLAIEYGVSNVTIANVINKVTWKK